MLQWNSIWKFQSVFLSTNSVDTGHWVCNLIPISQVREVSLGKLLQINTVSLCPMPLKILMFSTAYTQLVLHPCQLSRPDWPEAVVLAFCCPGLEEIWLRSGKEAGWLWSKSPLSFSLSTFSLPLTLLAGLHPEWMNTVHFYLQGHQHPQLLNPLKRDPHACRLVPLIHPRISGPAGPSRSPCNLSISLRMNEDLLAVSPQLWKPSYFSAVGVWN